MQTQQIFGVDRGGMMFSAKSASVRSNGSGFEQLIQMSQNLGTANEQTQKPAEGKQNSAQATDKAEQSEKMAGLSSERKESLSTKEGKAELKKTDVTQEADDIEAAERVAGVLNQVAEAVKDVLGLSDEELQQMLEQLGITSAQLIQPETLQNLVLMANSEQDAVILLTDAELLGTVNELIAQVDQILNAAGITPEELLQSFGNQEFADMVEDALASLTKEENTGEEETVKINVDSAPETTEESDKIELHTEKKDTDSSANDKYSDDFAETDNFAEQFIQNLQQAAQELGEITGQNDMVQMIREVADQMLEKFKVSVNADTTSLEIVLTPEELGRVNLTVTTDSDGVMNAKFVTENALAKEAIERNLVQFKEMLQEQGLKVDNIEVAVGNFEFDKNGQAGDNSQEEQRQGNRRFLTDDEIGQKDDNDQLARVFMEGGESTVNYMA